MVKRKYFRGFSAAKNWADKKNERARVNRWVVQARDDGPGYVASCYNAAKYRKAHL